MTFLEKLLSASRQNNSLLCVGLDPDPALMPVPDTLEFNRAIIEATADMVCAYKPNFAFYLAQGFEGLEALRKTVSAVPQGIPVIGDVKMGDIGNTARAYAKACYEFFGFDAVTANSYLGGDALEPFLGYTDRAVFVLCRTSNPGAADFQSLLCEGRPLYEVVAERARSWSTGGNIGLVVGATYPQELRRVRELCPDMPLLIPGVGAQGGDLAASVRYGVDSSREKAIINASRQVIYASRDKDYPQAARVAAQALREQINAAREGLSVG